MDYGRNLKKLEAWKVSVYEWNNKMEVRNGERTLIQKGFFPMFVGSGLGNPDSADFEFRNFGNRIKC
jgi:hypothetical protein